MTVVKVQRPIKMEGKITGPYLIYDKFRARESLHDELPMSMQRVFDSAPRNSQAFFRQYFDNAVWDELLERWDLENCTPVTRRLIW